MILLYFDTWLSTAMILYKCTSNEVTVYVLNLIFVLWCWIDKYYINGFLPIILLLVSLG